MKALTFVFVGTQWNSGIYTKEGIRFPHQMGLLDCLKNLEERGKFCTMLQTSPQTIYFLCIYDVYVYTCISNVCACAYVYLRIY